MNKQELIEELECLEVATDSLDFLRGANYATERAINLAKQLKEAQHSISSNDALKQIVITSIGENEIDIKIRGMSDKESVFILAEALISCCRETDIDENTLFENLSSLWKLY